MRATPLAVATSFALLTACTDVPTPTESAQPSLAGSEASTRMVSIYPGTSIQAKVDAYPAGTQFLLKRGTHRRQSVVPKSGNQFFGERDAAGKLVTILDGETVTDFAFHRGRGFPSNVRIEDLVIRRYAARLQMGAITGGGYEPAELTTGWVVEGCDIHDNAAAGVRLGNKMRVLRNYIHHNGQIGIVGTGDSILVEGNEIAYNNHLKEVEYGWEAGGTKFSRTRWLVVRNNFSHHNWGSGLWTDIHNIHTLYEGNRVEDNAAQGIFHEISYDAVIRNNTAARNGFERTWLYGAGILVAHSRNVEVYGNTVSGNFNGITAIQQDRGSGPYGEHLLENLNVHHNTITMSTGRTGVAQDVGDNAVFTSRNNRFAENTYYLAGNAKPFQWMNGSRTESQWQAYNQDVNGTFVR